MTYKYQLFIDKFKRIEQAVKLLDGYTDGSPVKFLEDYLDGTPLQTKIRLCRNVRNYIQHEPDYENFIEISQGMLDCLDEVLQVIEPSYNYSTFRSTIVIPSTSIEGVLNTISMYDHAILVDQNSVFMSVLTRKLICTYMWKNGLVGSALDIVNTYGCNRNCEFISSGMRRDASKISLLTATGEATEPVIGEIL